MPKKKTIPYCKQHRYIWGNKSHTYRQCYKCKSVEWSWTYRLTRGQGSGKKCPSCKKQTLHNTAYLPDLSTLRRCSTCNYASIQPYLERPS